MIEIEKTLKTCFDMRIEELLLQVHGIVETEKSKAIQKIKYREYTHVTVVA